MPHDVDYSRQAKRDFAWYAQMSAEELDFILKYHQASRRGRCGSGKQDVLRIARENPTMTLREIADAAGVVYDYAWRVLKGAR